MDQDKNQLVDVSTLIAKPESSSNLVDVSSLIEKKNGISVSSPIKSELSSPLQKSESLTDLSFLSKVGNDMVAKPYGMVEPVPEIGKTKQIDISLKPIKEQKSYYNVPLEKGLIFDKEGKIYAPSSEALTKEIKPTDIKLDLKKSTQKDLVEKAREMPIEEKYPEGEWSFSRAAQQVTDQFWKTALEGGEWLALKIRENQPTEWSELDTPKDLFSKGGLTEYGKNIDWKKDPLGAVAIGLNGLKNISEEDIKYNRLPNTTMGNFVEGALSFVPDVALSELVPEQAATKAASTAEKLGRLLLNNFTKYLGVKGAVTGYVESKEKGESEQAATMNSIKNGAIGLRDGALYAAAGAGGNLATKSTMNYLEKAGFTGAKGMTAREIANYMYDAALMGTTVPAAQSIMNGTPLTKDEMVKSAGYSLLFGLKRTLSTIKTNADLNAKMKDIQSIKQGVAAINFGDADIKTIVQLHNDTQSADQLYAQGLELIKKAKESTDINEKNRLVAEASTYIKAGNVKQVTKLAVDNPHFSDVMQRADIPQNVKDNILNKAAILHEYLNPENVNKNKLGIQVQELTEQKNALEDQLKSQTDAVLQSETRARIGIVGEALNHVTKELDKITERQARSKRPEIIVDGTELKPDEFNKIAATAPPEIIGEAESAQIPLEEQPQVETEKITAEAPFVTKTGNQQVTLENGILKVTDVKTGNEVSPTTRRKAILEYADNFIYNKGKTASEVVTEIPSGLSDKEINRFVVDHSQNPLELASIYLNEPSESKLSGKEFQIAQFGLGKLTPESFARFGDKNLLNRSIALTYLSAKEGTPIDVIAKEMSDYYGTDITPQDIVDFMVNHPRGTEYALREGESMVAREAADKFNQLTGLNLNKTNAEKIINSEFDKLSDAEKQLAEQNYENEQQLQNAYWDRYEATNGFTKESISAEAKPTEEPIKKEKLEEEISAEKNAKINNVYQNNPQIAQIGTQEEYAKYIQNIFPDSKINDIVYHSTNKSFDNFDVTKVATRKEGAPQAGDVGAFGRGIYFTPNETYSKIYGKNTKSVVLNIKNPKVILNNEANDKLYQNKSIKDLWGDYDAVIYKVTDWKAVTESGMHASMEEFNSVGLGKNNKPEIVDIVISNENQAHILGSDKDIEGFKNWKKYESPKKTYQEVLKEKQVLQAPKVTGTKKIISTETRDKYNLPLVEPSKLGTDYEILNEGKRLVESGEINPNEVIQKALESDTPSISPQEEKAMLYHMYQLNAEAERLGNEISRTDLTPEEIENIQQQSGQLTDMIDAATRANLKRGTSWGQFGNIRQIEVTTDYQPAAERALIESSYGGKENVPTDVKNKLDAAIKEIEEARAEIKRLENSLKDKQAKSAIESIKKEPKEKIDHKAKRAELRTKLKDAVEKAKKEQSERLKGAELMGAGMGFNPTPEMLKIIGEIAADYVKEGYEKLNDLIEKVNEEIKGIIPGIRKEDIRDAIAFREAEKLSKRAEKIELQIKEKKLSSYNAKLRETFESSKEWVRQNQRLLNAKNSLKKLKIEALNSEKSKFQIGMKWLSKIFRASVLSGFNVLGKLASAATIGGAVKRLPEQAIGKVYNKIFSRIAEKAPIEGTYSKVLGGFYSEFFNPKKFWRNTLRILKTGEGELNAKMGSMPREDLAEITMPGDQNTKINEILKKGLKVTDYTLSVPMNTHMIIKDPLKRAAFVAAFNSGMQWAEANGFDINDALIINSIENMAYKRANYEVFLEQNAVSKWLNTQKSVLEREKGNVGALSKTFIDFMVPVSTVPTNIARRILSTSPLGLGRGLYKTAEAYSKSIEDLKPEEADAIMRQLKQGTLGTALWLIGWFGYSHFGGLYTKYDPNKKREMGDLKSDEMMVNGKMIPKPAQHALPFEIIQTAATARHIYNNYVDNKGVGTFNALLNAGLGSIGALAEKVPVIETGALMVEAVKDPYKGEKLQEDLSRRFKPQILRELGIVGGKDIDKFIEKNTSTFNVYKNELKAYNKEGQQIPITNEKFIEYKNKLKDNLVGRMSFLFIHGAYIKDDNNRVVQVSYQDLKDKYPEKLNELITREKTKATKETREALLGEKMDTYKQEFANEKLELANERWEKQYQKSLKQ